VLIVKRIVIATATYSVPTGTSEPLRAHHCVHQVHERGDTEQQGNDCHEVLNPVADDYEGEYGSESHECHDHHCSGEHLDPYDRNHAAMNITTVLAAISQPASVHGHTGALMNRLSRST
jgi:hypothetical protein